MHPRRWNPVKVVVRPLATRERVEGYWERGGDDQFGDPVEMRGQPNFKRSRWQDQDHGYAGDQQETKGHILFLVTDFGVYGYTPQKGDAIVEVASMFLVGADAFRVVEMRPSSPLRGRALFFKCFVEQDRKLLGMLP